MMKAQIVEAPGKLVLKEVAKPTLSGPGEIIVKVSLG